MNIEKIDEHELEYNILEVKYIKTMGRQVSMDPRINEDLYPLDWFSNGNLIEKSRILLEAIEKKCLIINTLAYANIQEGVRCIKEDEEER